MKIERELFVVVEDAAVKTVTAGANSKTPGKTFDIPEVRLQLVGASGKVADRVLAGIADATDRALTKAFMVTNVYFGSLGRDNAVSVENLKAGTTVVATVESVPRTWTDANGVAHAGENCRITCYQVL